MSHENRGRDYQGVKIRLEAAIDGSQKEVVPYSLVVGDDWAVRKWSKSHIISMSDRASAMLKPNMLTTGRIGVEPTSLLEWISTYDYRASHDYFSRQRQPNTGNWISETREFKRWFDGRESACFWCSGIRK